MTTQKINTFDKSTANQILDDLSKLLDSFAAERGISVGKMRGTIAATLDGLKVSVELATVSESGAANTPESRAWKQECQHEWTELTLAGFTADDLGAEFVVQGKRFTIAGFKTRARKRPVLANEVGTGAQFVFPVEAVARLMGKQAKSLDDQPFNLKR